MAGITRAPGVRYAVLTPNLKGYEAARAAGADAVAIFASASEGFSKANLNATIAESIERFVPVAEAARRDGVPEEESRARRTATIPAGRLGTAAEFGAACAFLCSAHAGYIVGQNILLDGGAFASTI